MIIGSLSDEGRCNTARRELRIDADNITTLPRNMIPVYPTHWAVYVISWPHDDEEFITAQGIDRFYTTRWRISPSSNRLGFAWKLPTSSDKIQWARESGVKVAPIPATYSIMAMLLEPFNINGDTPVILTKEGPDMGGYPVYVSVATAEMYVQLRMNCSFDGVASNFCVNRT